MQQPPPGPMQPASAGGIDKKTGSWLSYLLWWITGIIMLFVGKNDPDVKFHAAQSVVFFGSITVLNIILSILGAINALHFLVYIADLVWLFGFIWWIIALVKAFGGNGERFELPLVGGVIAPYAEQLAAGVK
jgi:uncharacterized membrane protein